MQSILCGLLRSPTASTSLLPAFKALLPASPRLFTGRISVFMARQSAGYTGNSPTNRRLEAVVVVGHKMKKFKAYKL
ncbi:hypothetical protein AVEN_245190-1, partial [Araneus ventricosus]